MNPFFGKIESFKSPKEECFILLATTVTIAYTQVSSYLLHYIRTKVSECVNASQQRMRIIVIEE